MKWPASISSILIKISIFDGIIELYVMDVIKKMLDKYNVSFSEKSIERFTTILERKEYLKDEIILNQGQVSRYMYIVEKGIIRQF